MFLITRYLNYTLTAIAIIALSFAMITTSDANLDEKTIAGMWTFEEGKGKVVTDLSGNGTDGEFVGDLKWAKGKFGGGLEFNGQDTWVKLGTKGEDKTLAALDFKESEGFSVHAWVYAAEDPTGKCVVWKGLGCSTWSQFLLGTGAHENGENTTNASFHIRDNNGGKTWKSLAMNSRRRNGCTLSVLGMEVKIGFTSMGNYKGPRMLRDRLGHVRKKFTSAQTPAVANAVSGTVSLTKLLFST